MEKIILFSLFFFMIGGVLATQNFITEIVPHFYSDGYELSYYGQDFDAVSFDLIGYRNNYRNIYDVNVNFTPSVFNDGIKINNLKSDGMIFARTKIFPIDEIDKVFVITTGKNSLNEDMYSEVFINITDKKSILKNIGKSIDKNDYKIGLFVFLLLSGIILFILYKISRK